MKNLPAALLFGSVALTSLVPWSCTRELTVKDAQTGFDLACRTLATVLHDQHPEATPEALTVALQACNVERTTKVIELLLAIDETSDAGSTSSTEVLPLDLRPLEPVSPHSARIVTDAGGL